MHFFKKVDYADSYEYETNRMEMVKKEDNKMLLSLRQCQDLFLSLFTPKDIYTRLDRAEPFLYGSMLAWPVIWSYRGLRWISVRPYRTDRLMCYIQKTNTQARLVQAGILSMGLLVAMGNIPKEVSGEEEPELDFLF